ncbi:RNA polymerase sigma factor [Candidatus Nomurabacteria bacterium]|nr:RNA polymerase sigma factor [Candidatus Nomurabacteria bacterium]
MNKNLYSLDDYTLVLQFAAGNSEAFNVIVKRHQPYLASVVFPIVQDLHLTEDILQEAFIKAIIAIKEGKYHMDSKHAFRAWIRRIVCNLAIDHVRGGFKKKSTWYYASEDIDLLTHSICPIYIEQGPEETFIRRESLRVIPELLERIPAEQREVIYLHLFKRCTFRKITECIDSTISINTIQTRMYLGLKNLRKMMESVLS